MRLRVRTDTFDEVFEPNPDGTYGHIAQVFEFERHLSPGHRAVRIIIVQANGETITVSEAK